MVLIDGFGDLWSWSLIRYQYHFLPTSNLIFFLNKSLLVWNVSFSCICQTIGKASLGRDTDDRNGKMMPKMVMEMKRWWFYLPEKLTIRHNQGWKQFVKNDCFLSNRNPKSLGHSCVNNKWLNVVATSDKMFVCLCNNHIDLTTRELNKYLVPDM